MSLSPIGQASAHVNTAGEGELRQITVLFAEIVKSSEYLKKFDAETVEDLFAQVILQQIEITRKFHGTVNQVMSDGIMCLFGVEEPFEGHALRALAVGQEMAQSVSDVAKLYNMNVHIRVGINTGDVILAKTRNE